MTLESSSSPTPVSSQDINVIGNEVLEGLSNVDHQETLSTVSGNVNETPCPAGSPLPLAAKEEPRGSLPIEESAESRIERLGRQRPEVFSSVWSEIGFVFSISMSQVLSVNPTLAA